MKEADIRDCQKSLVESVFKAGDIREYVKSLGQSIQVMTWDQKVMVWMTSGQIHEMFLETSIIGPLAAMFGREFQQYLLVSMPTDKIAVTDMQFSVNSGRASLTDKKIDMVKHRKVEVEREEERRYQSEKRTRSPRARTTCAEPYKKSPSTRCDIDLREVQEERRPRDIRVKEEPGRERSQEGLRLPRTSDVRDRCRRASEPRTYVKRPRSEDQQNKEDRPKDRERRRV